VTTAKNDGKAVILSEQDAAFIRQALVAAADVFAQAKAAGGPGLRALQEAAASVPGTGRPLARVHYDVCLAVDHLDFPSPARSTR
jgi:predicted RNA polymerase sigma factor